MPTIQQYIRGIRKSRKRKSKTPAFLGSCHRKGVCVRVFTLKPKKPNSSQRKVAKVKLSSGKSVFCKIPGQGHNLQKHTQVLIRGGRARDIPGTQYHVMRGLRDFVGVEKFTRVNRRSKFGMKNPNKKEKNVGI